MGTIIFAVLIALIIAPIILAILPIVLVIGASIIFLFIAEMFYPLDDDKDS